MARSENQRETEIIKTKLNLFTADYLYPMDAFASIPPEWTNRATHALDFGCPNCQASAAEAKEVWLNRRAPVSFGNNRRKWQEFYWCECDTVWWAWSSDRPTSDLSDRKQPPLF